MTMKRDDRTRTAFHEAGHAVAAVLSSRPFKFVSMRSLKERANGMELLFTEGVVYTSESERERHALLRRGELPDWELFISMAGMIAETIHVGQYDDECRAGGAYDLHNVNVAMAIRLGCRPDEVPVRPEWKAVESDAIDRCFGTLSEHWQAVERVADALVRHGKLRCETVQTLVAGEAAG